MESFGHVYIVSWSYSPSLLSCNSSWTHPNPFIILQASCPLLRKSATESNYCCPYVHWWAESWAAYQMGTFHQEKWFSLLQKPSAPLSSPSSVDIRSPSPLQAGIFNRLVLVGVHVYHKPVMSLDKPFTPLVSIA